MYILKNDYINVPELQREDVLIYQDITLKGDQYITVPSDQSHKTQCKYSSNDC